MHGKLILKKKKFMKRIEWRRERERDDGKHQGGRRRRFNQRGKTKGMVPKREGK